MKKVTMTNAEVKGLIEGMNAITAASLPLSPRIWFTLTVNRKTLIDQNKLIEDTRLELVSKFSTEDENGKKSVPPENMEDFSREYNDLLSIEVSMKLKQIPLVDLEKVLDKLEGVTNLFLIFQYLISDDNEKETDDDVAVVSDPNQLRIE